MRYDQVVGAQPEAVFKSHVRRLILAQAKRGVPVFAVSLSDAIVRGIPDLLMCVRGRYMAVELKVDTPLAELQLLFLMEVRRANGIAGVLRKKHEKDLGTVVYYWLPINKDGTKGANLMFRSIEEWWFHIAQIHLA